jgi:Mg-chelatase subunit ChlD
LSGQGAEGFKDLGDLVAEAMRQAIADVERCGPCSYIDDEAMDAAAAEATGAGSGKRADVPLYGPINPIKAQQVSAGLRRRMKTLIEASRRLPIKVRDEGHEISERHLVHIAVGDPRVFAHRAPHRAVNTAIVVLVDRSGSMEGAPIMVANEAAYAVALSLSSIREAKCAVLAFPAHAGAAVLKPFDRQVVRPQDFACSAGGGTPLKEALYRSAAMLVRRREERKILIVATDGQPDDPDGAKLALRMLTHHGVECVGVGIRCNAVTGLFQEATVIQALEDLPAALFGLLQRRLVA